MKINTKPSGKPHSIADAPSAPIHFVAEGIRDNGKLYYSQGCFEVAERETPR